MPMRAASSRLRHPPSRGPKRSRKRTSALRAERFGPRAEEVRDHVVDAVADVRACEDDGPALAHALGIALHDVEARADVRCEIDLVDDEEIALRHSGTAFARDFVTAGDVDDVDGE